MLVGFGCLQRAVATGTAQRLSVRCGTMSEGGACGNNNVGQLGLQRIAAGGSAMLQLLRHGSSSKDGASDNSGLLP